MTEGLFGAPQRIISQYIILYSNRESVPICNLDNAEIALHSKTRVI